MKEIFFLEDGVNFMNLMISLKKNLKKNISEADAIIKFPYHWANLEKKSIKTLWVRTLFRINFKRDQLLYYIII